MRQSTSFQGIMWHGASFIVWHALIYRKHWWFFPLDISLSSKLDSKGHQRVMRSRATILISRLRVRSCDPISIDRPRSPKKVWHGDCGNCRRFFIFHVMKSFTRRYLRRVEELELISINSLQAISNCEVKEITPTAPNILEAPLQQGEGCQFQMMCKWFS